MNSSATGIVRAIVNPCEISASRGGVMQRLRKVIQKLWLKFLYASYRACDRVRGKILGAMIRSSAIRLEK